jgi:hypothetical protein
MRVSTIKKLIPEWVKGQEAKLYKESVRGRKILKVNISEKQFKRVIVSSTCWNQVGKRYKEKNVTNYCARVFACTGLPIVLYVITDPTDSVIIDSYIHTMK